MKKIIVTGGAGYIGSHTVVELVNAGYTPVIIDDLRNSHARVLKGLADLIGQQPIFHSVDLNQLERVHEVFKIEGEVFGVIHFAAYKAVGESVAEPLKYYENNIGSLVNVLRVMQWRGVQQFVFSSSCAVYGDPDHCPVTEDSPTREATSPYAYTKVVSERIIRDTCISDPSLKAVMLRYFNPIGAHPSARIGELPIGVPSNLVPFIAQTAMGIRKELVVYGNDYPTHDGSCVRDFIHVVDLARAHVRALEWMAAQPAPLREVFNLGTGHGNSVLETLRIFMEESGVQVPHRMGPRRPGDVVSIWADATKSHEVLGWSCEHDLRDGLRDSWRWQQALSKASRTVQ